MLRGAVITATAGCAMGSFAMNKAEIDDMWATPDPDGTRVRCESTKGPFVLEVNPSWSPLGAKRFLELVRADFFRDMPMIRAVEGFLVQFGVNGDPAVQRRWDAKGPIADDPHDAGRRFRKGSLSFAGGGPNTRTTSVFIGYSADEGQLGAWGKSPWETPFGGVVEGMAHVDAFYKGYGDFKGLGGGAGVDWQRVMAEGNAYVKPNFPKMDFITSCGVEPPLTRPSAVLRGAKTGGAAAKFAQVQCETSKGPLSIEVRPDWSPHGAERYLKLVRAGFFTNVSRRQGICRQARARAQQHTHTHALPRRRRAPFFPVTRCRPLPRGCLLNTRTSSTACRRSHPTLSRSSAPRRCAPCVRWSTGGGRSRTTSRSPGSRRRRGTWASAGAGPTRARATCGSRARRLRKCTRRSANRLGIRRWRG